MDFKQFEREVENAVKGALKDETVHLRRALSGEVSVICGYVSPDRTQPGVIISRRHFSVGQYKAGKVDLHEEFEYMFDDINEQLEYMMVGK